jgi:signal transduction histidine kinase
MTLQTLLLGNQTIETESERRKILLSAYLIFTFLGVDAFFLIISAINPEGEPWSLLLGTVISMVCLGLIRKSHINTAVSLHLIRSNFITFYFSLIDTDPYQTATYMYFISSSLGALAIFGYNERWKGIGFSLLSFALFVFAYFDYSRFSVDDVHFYFVVNFSIVLLIGMLIMMFYGRLVADSEKAIVQKNAALVQMNSELVKTNQELDRFVYSASHDLRAPLSSMLGLIEIAQHAKSEQEASQYLEMMKGRVRVLDTFIKQIVDYSRNSRIEPHYETIDVRILLDGVHEQLKFLPEFETVEVEFGLPAAWCIRSEKNRLKIVFENIFSNAIKYRNRNSQRSYLKISGTENETSYRFTIEDNGIGIPEQLMDKVFEMFFRAHEGSQGSGLGLYIVKETLAKLGGSITVDSHVGEGSVFIIELPKSVTA